MKTRKTMTTQPKAAAEAALEYSLTALASILSRGVLWCRNSGDPRSKAIDEVGGVGAITENAQRMAGELKTEQGNIIAKLCAAIITALMEHRYNMMLLADEDFQNDGYFVETIDGIFKALSRDYSARLRDAAVGLRDGGDDKTGAGDSPAEHLSLDARAVGVLSDNKHFTKVSQVANVLEVSHQALSPKKCPLFRGALDALTQSAPPPRGFRNDEGDTESSSDGKPTRSHRERNRLPE